jgi:hypothetical protein
MLARIRKEEKNVEKEATLSSSTPRKSWKKKSAAAVDDSDEVIRRCIHNFCYTEIEVDCEITTSHHLLKLTQ